MGVLWELLPIEWRAGLLVGAALAALAVLSGVPLYYHHQWYSDGYAAGYAQRQTEDEAVARQQQAAIDKIRADVAQQLADVAAILRKAQDDDAIAIAAVDQAAANAAGADAVCLPADVVHHIRVYGRP